jgi:serine/threonine-protein kinase
VKCTTCGTALDSRATFCPNCGATVPDPYIGTTIAGRYLAERRIAIGGFGSIYRGQEIVSARPIALKIMHRELAGDANLVARFRREGTVLRKLLNAHAVQTYELGETIDGLPFIAMELLEGDTLLGTFRSAGGRLPWQRVFGLARGVCSALGEAHGLGIIHRDLKPANIFVTANDVVKVLDFGIAKILASSEVSDPRELTIMGTAVGTLEYMAPEQLMGGKADPRTDIYTLGVVIYEVITGRRPFNAAGLELLTEQLSSEPPPVSSHVEVPPEVDRVLARCLAQDVDDRFASAMELSRALDEALLHAPPVVATAPPPPQQRVAPAPSFSSHAQAPTARAALRTDPIRPLPSRRIFVISVISISLIAGWCAARAARLRCRR